MQGKEHHRPNMHTPSGHGDRSRRRIKYTISDSTLIFLSLWKITLTIVNITFQNSALPVSGSLYLYIVVTGCRETPLYMCPVATRTRHISSRDHSTKILIPYSSSVSCLCLLDIKLLLLKVCWQPWKNYSCTIMDIP